VNGRAQIPLILVVAAAGTVRVDVLEYLGTRVPASVGRMSAPAGLDRSHVDLGSQME